MTVVGGGPNRFSKNTWAGELIMAEALKGTGESAMPHSHSGSRVPTGYRIPPHSHPVIEHVTVVSGAFSIGKGEQWDDSKLVRLDAGDFIGRPQPEVDHILNATISRFSCLKSTMLSIRRDL